MAWQHRGSAAPPSFGYEAPSHPNPPYGTPSIHHDERGSHHLPPSAYGPPAVQPPPSSHAPYGLPALPPHHRHLPQQSSPSMAPPQVDDHWYDHQHQGVQPSPWRHDPSDSRSFEQTVSTEIYHSPEILRQPLSPFHHPTSSTRGGRRPETQQANIPPPGSTYRTSGPSSNLPLHRPLFQQRLKRNDLTRTHSSEREEWEIPRSAIKSASSKFSEKQELAARATKEDKDKKQDESKTEVDGNKDGEDGDPLALLANVSSEMDSSKRSKNSDGALESSKKIKDNNKSDDQLDSRNASAAMNKSLGGRPGKDTKVPPTSPLQRRLPTSPLITPNMSSETDNSNSRKGHEPRQGRQRVVRTLTPKPITPTAAPHYHQQKPTTTSQSYTPYDEPDRSRDYPYYGSAGSFPPPPSSGQSYPYPPTSYGPVPIGRDASWEQPQHSPVVVEHNSFDSGESSGYRYPPEYSYPHYHGPPQPRGRHYSGESPYPQPETAESAWYASEPRRDDKAPEYTSPLSPYPSHRWSYDGPPPPSPMGGVSRYHGPPPPSQYQQYPRTGGPPPRIPQYPTPSPYYHHNPEGTQYDVSNKGSPDVAQHYSPAPPMPPHHMAAYHMYHPHPSYPPHMGGLAYTYVQQPNIDEKTVLRKKFSWKHFPELERFLIENRDDYLQFSSRNYTVEQKQFNNQLTERLIELAEKNNYVFDQQDFNFVAIRDRIRCYYKSYVQTARKRGMSLPNTGGSSKGSKRAKYDHDGASSVSSAEHERDESENNKDIKQDV